MPAPGRGFAEKVAVVTNGARGVGRAVALQLALAGAYVVVSYPPDDSEGATISDDLRRMGTLGDGLAVDVAQSSDVERLFAAVDEKYGRLDQLVCVAGAAAEKNFGDLTESEWDAVVGRDLKGAFLCAQAGAPRLRKRPAPAIVNIVTASDGASSAAARGGIVELTRVLAKDLGPLGVRVNCVTVGRVEGRQRDRLDRADESSPGAGESSAAPADEAARACLYLLSPEARLISGQTLLVGS